MTGEIDEGGLRKKDTRFKISAAAAAKMDVFSGRGAGWTVITDYP